METKSTKKKHNSSDIKVYSLGGLGVVGMNMYIVETNKELLIMDSGILFADGTINGVEEYQSVTINGERIPFIGNNIGIKTIFSTDGKYLYNNNLLTKESNLENFESITELNVKTFGENYEKAQQKVF